MLTCETSGEEPIEPVAAEPVRVPAPPAVIAPIEVEHVTVAVRAHENPTKEVEVRDATFFVETLERLLSFFLVERDAKAGVEADATLRGQATPLFLANDARFTFLEASLEEHLREIHIGERE